MSMLSTYFPTDNEGNLLKATTGETVEEKRFLAKTYITIYYRDKSII